MEPPSRPPRRAVALNYDPLADPTPRVAASGQGFLAAEIIRRAREAGVPIHQDPDLVELLGKLDVGDAIPPELYLVVAEILAYLYRLNRDVSHTRTSHMSAETEPSGYDSP